MKKHFYGGQAVIEGVMIRGQKNCVVAVINPEKNIVIKQIKIPSFSKALYKKIPFIRGVIILLEMMVIGYRSLTKSSEIVEENQNLNISTIEKLSLSLNTFASLPTISSTSWNRPLLKRLPIKHFIDPVKTIIPEDLFNRSSSSQYGWVVSELLRYDFDERLIKFL